MIKITSRKDLRNYILKLISKYSETENMISDKEVKNILKFARRYDELNYIKSLYNNCQKNLSKKSIELLSIYLGIDFERNDKKEERFTRKHISRKFKKKKKREKEPENGVLDKDLLLRLLYETEDYGFENVIMHFEEMSDELNNHVSDEIKKIK